MARKSKVNETTLIKIRLFERFLSIVFALERTNQLSLLPDKDLVDLCPPIEPYQVTKNQKSLLFSFKINLLDSFKEPRSLLLK
ncbi:hypothetical protein [Microcystis sp. M_OC_Ca_00000000_S217Cul]|uniref:hypothetical protein n=1 Tax=Microcystis sp. M_OC_Ca_00000000_S217Cul TaxID=2486214 RepID=UPI00257FE5BB|nr:hypothetical protein [Microcystis sp. M_OC_Ca_00000000_S217Cul]